MNVGMHYSAAEHQPEDGREIREQKKIKFNLMRMNNMRQVCSLLL